MTGDIKSKMHEGPAERQKANVFSHIEYMKVERTRIVMTIDTLSGCWAMNKDFRMMRPKHLRVWGRICLKMIRIKV